MRLFEFDQHESHCFDNSWRLMMDIAKREPTKVLDTYRLIHASVTNAEGRTFPHAWLEHDGQSIDSARSKDDPIIMDASKFRDTLNATDVIEYTPEEAMITAARQGHYGPWDQA